MTLQLRLGMAAVLLAILTATAAGEPISQLQPSNYVNDFAHVLTPSAVAQMSALCRQIDQKAQAQIAVVTVNTLEGSDIETYAVDLFKKWGVGRKGTDRGVLILYAIQDRRARIEVGYGLEPILPDGKVGGFQREAIPQMRSGDYSGAILLVTTRVAQTIAQDAGVQLSDVPPAPVRPRNDRGGDGFSIGGFILIVIIIVVVLATPLRGVAFWILLSILSGGRGGGGFGSSSDGGFGGFGGGSDGGFGGFGGGSSGGGGASSSW